MKKTLLVVILSIIPLTGCILLGMYSYTTTVKFTEIVRLPDGKDVTIKRKQWIEKESYYVGKSSRSIKEQLVIIDPETQKKLPLWENEHKEQPYFLYRESNKECEWVLIANPFRQGRDYFIEKGYFKIMVLNNRKYYTPTVIAYCLSKDYNQWKKISVPNYVIGKGANIWVNDSSRIPEKIIQEKNSRPKNNWTSSLNSRINDKFPFTFHIGDY